MDKEQAIQEVQYLGLDKRDYRVLLLIPLVHVAWADDQVVANEAKLIRDAAAKLGATSDDAKRQLTTWLEHQPTEAYLSRARKLIRELAPHTIGLGKDITQEDLTFVVEQCRAIARAASGLFGMFRYEAKAQAALDDIVDDLDPDSIDYANVVEWDEDDWADEEAEEEWDDEEWDDDDEWEDEEEEGGGAALKLGVSKAKVTQSTLKRVKSIQDLTAKAQADQRADGRKRRVAPTARDAAKGAGAAVEVKPPGFDD